MSNGFDEVIKQLEDLQTEEGLASAFGDSLGDQFYNGLLENHPDLTEDQKINARKQINSNIKAGKLNFQINV